jgi:hypothetical protein
MSLYLAQMMLIIWNKEQICLSGKFWESWRIPIQESQFRGCLKQRRFRPMGRCTTEWAIQQWAVMAPSSPRWVVSARMAVPKWGTPQLDWVPYLIETKTITSEGGKANAQHSYG